MNDVVIKVENLSKKYRLGVINRRQLVDQIESWIARKTGRPDPHASVFEQSTDRMPTPHDFWALKDISFEIKRGDIVGIMGRNGSGKSTLLKLLSRITAPTSGKAYLKGRLASLLEVGTGFNYDMTGTENVFLNGSILGLTQREIKNRYAQIADFAEIQDFMETPVKRYSSGMRVRLAFAVAAHLEPDILILDEVLAVGDAKFQEKCLNKISEIKKSGATILFVSHSAQSVLELCNKGMLLKEGRLQCVGTATEVTRTYLESIHMSGSENEEFRLHDEGRVSNMKSMISGYLHNLKGGKVAINLRIENNGDNNLVELGWLSQERQKSIRTLPTWSAAPDICVSFVAIEKSPESISSDFYQFFKNGAMECWAVHPNGDVHCYKRGETSMYQRLKIVDQEITPIAPL
jgi:lipopolysaccharide transport system ATP-binding protein